MAKYKDKPKRKSKHKLDPSSERKPKHQRPQPAQKALGRQNTKYLLASQRPSFLVKQSRSSRFRHPAKVHPAESKTTTRSSGSNSNINVILNPNRRRVRKTKKGCFTHRARNTVKEHRIAAKYQREIEEEKANMFKKITVEKINYTSLLVKEDRLRVKDIPLVATSQGTTLKLNRWWNCCCCKHPVPDTEAPKYPDNDSESESDYEVKITEKQWRTDFWAQVAVFALAFSASNLFRFPYDCYYHGGSTFFVAYMLIMIVLMQPLIYLEMLIGQFSQTGVSGFAELHLYAKGLPMAITFMSLFFVPYNNMVLGYAGAYVFGATYTSSELCQPYWNQLQHCIPYATIRRINNNFPSDVVIWHKNSSTVTGLLSSELYFRQYILSQNWYGGTNEDFLGWNPKIMVGLGVSYVIVLFCTMDYLTSKFSKAIILTSLLVPVAALVLTASQYFCDGATLGLLDFLAPDWSTITSFDGFWADALRHAFSSLGVGYGLFPRIASKNAFNFAKLYKTSWIICLLTGLLSALTSAVAFTELGIIRRAFHLTDYHKIFAERTGIGFIGMSGAMMKLGKTWPTVVFFVLFSVGGIWPLIVATETCLSYLVQWLPRKVTLKTLRRMCCLIVILIQFLSALLTSRAGALMLDSPNLFDGTWSACFVCLTEVFLVVYLYGFKLFSIDTEIMLRHSLPKMFQFQLRFTCPILLLGGLALLSFENIARPTQKYLGTVPNPTWLTVVGYILNTIPVLLIVGFGLYAIKNFIKLKRLNKKNFRPGDEHIAQMYKRLRMRRGNIMEAGKEDEFREDNQMAAFRRRYAISIGLRATLYRLMRRQRAISLWQRIFNKVLLAENKVNTLFRFIMWVVREQHVVKNRKEASYIFKILECFSLENLFCASELEDHGNSREDYLRVADTHLNSVSKSKLGLRYKPLTYFQIVVGKRNPVPEEDKRATIIRIKRHLRLPTRRDQVILDKVIRIENAKSHAISVYHEDPPLQFYFKNISKRMRVILVHGETHTFVRNLPQPKPKFIFVNQDEIPPKTDEIALLDTLKRLVVNDMKSSGFSAFRSMVRLATSSSSLIRALAGSPKVSKLHLDEQQNLSELPNWFYMADLRQYKVIPAETYVVVVVDENDVLEQNPFRWMMPSERRRNWSGFTVELAEHEHEIIETTLADLYYHQNLIEQRDLAFQIPSDIRFHQRIHFPDRQDSELGLMQSNSVSTISSSSSSDSSGFLTLRANSWSSFGSHSGSGSGSGSSGSDSPASSIGWEGPLHFNSDDSFEAEEFSETDLRYLRQGRKTRLRMLYPLKVNSETALEEARSNAFGTQPVDRPYLELKSILEPKDMSQTKLQFESEPEEEEDDEPTFEAEVPQERRRKKKEHVKKEKVHQEVRLKGRRQPSVTEVDSDDYLWNSPSSDEESDTFQIPLFNSKELLALENDSRISTRCVWSQASITSQVQGLGADRRNSHNILHSAAYNYMKNTRIQRWNEHEQFIYRPQGKMLVVEKIDEKNPIIVFAQPGDSIASIGPMNEIEDEESRLTMLTRHRNTLQSRVLGSG